MSRELAKELKDGGYTQGVSIWLYSADGLYQPRLYKGAVFTNETDAPTLEELIEACGEDFERMTRGRDPVEEWNWYAHSDSRRAEGHGDTPIEAVARLWLALNTLQDNKSA